MHNSSNVGLAGNVGEAAPPDKILPSGVALRSCFLLPLELALHPQSDCRDDPEPGGGKSAGLEGAASALPDLPPGTHHASIVAGPRAVTSISGLGGMLGVVCFLAEAANELRLSQIRREQFTPSIGELQCGDPAKEIAG